MIENEIIVVKRITTNEWVKDLNSVNKDKIEGSFKSADGTRAKTRLGRGIDKNTGQKKSIFDSTVEGKKEQKELEESLGLTEGTLGVNSPFWDDFTVDIEGSLMVLKPSESPMDRLKLLVLKSKTTLVSEGYNNRTDKTEFVILSENEEAKKSNNMRKSKKDAYMEFGKMSHSEMEDVLIALGKKPVGMSKEMIEDALGREIETSPSKVLSVIKNPKYKAILHLNKLVNMGVVTKKGTSIIYEELTLGYNIEDAIDYLNNKDNRSVTEALNSLYASKVKEEKEIKK